MAKSAKKKGFVPNEQDLVSNRLLLLLTIAFIAALGLMFLYRGFNTPGRVVFTYNLTLGVVILSGICLLLSLIWYFRNKKIKADEINKTITSGNTLKLCCIVFIASFLVYRYAVIAIRALYVAIPLYVALYFIYKVYSRGLFTISVMCSVNGIIFYLLDRLQNNISLSPYIMAIVAAFGALCVFELFTVAAAAKHEGKIGSITIMRNNEKTVWLYLEPAVSLVAVAAWFAVRGEVMRYGMFATIACALVGIVVYTADLMANG